MKNPTQEAIRKFLQPSYDFGVHAHALPRNELKTMTDGPHTHLFVVPTNTPESAVLYTECDGLHGHKLTAMDAELTSKDGAHQHVVRIYADITLASGVVLKAGETYLTELDGEHQHSAGLLMMTGVDGAHTHRLVIEKDGQKLELVSLGVSQYWQAFGPMDLSYLMPLMESRMYYGPSMLEGAVPAQVHKGYIIEKPLLTDLQKTMLMAMGLYAVTKGEEVEFDPEDIVSILFDKERYGDQAAVVTKLKEMGMDYRAIKEDESHYKVCIGSEDESYYLHPLPVQMEAGHIQAQLGYRRSAISKATEIQTLIFDKEKFTESEASQWLKDNGFANSGVDETGSSYRYRQKDPSEFTRMRTISLTSGVKAVVGPTKNTKKEDVLSELDCQILKADDEKRVVTGIVLEPETIDAQADVMSEAEIERTAWDYVRKSRTIGFRHSAKSQAQLVESYIAPVSMTVGKQKVKKGTWIISVHIPDDETWDMVKKGDINAFSVGGYGKREEEK